MKSLLIKFKNFLRYRKWDIIATLQKPLENQILLSKYKNYYKSELDLLILEQFIKPGDNVLDIGANIGCYCYNLASFVGSEGSVIAFEPNSNARRILKKMIKKLNIINVIIEPYAISDCKKIQTLYLPPSSGRSSLYHFSDFNGVKTEEVKVMTLDSYIENKNLTHIEFIKIDVEGNEINVIEGAKKIISLHKPIILIESENRHLNQIGYDVLDLIKLMSEYGYEAFVNNKFNLISVSEIKIPADRVTNSSVPYYFNYWFVPQGFNCFQTNKYKDLLIAVETAGKRYELDKDMKSP